MKCLVVIAHPLPDSLCYTMARSAIAALTAAGHEVEIEDLYQNSFSPVITSSERQSYFQPPFDATTVQPQVERLLAAEAVVLVFPTWWFSLPAILKGWFDRVWSPGLAFDHAPQPGGLLQPKLHNLQRALAITSLNSPWWVDYLLLWQPVKRVLKMAILGMCAPRCRFGMLTCYEAESLTQEKVERFCLQIQKTIHKWSAS
ncbi:MULTISPECIES: NAD(P)H-dependent oxidoreductase [Leptolyngbya]|uniref:NAD(P)H-dependent oxidoreductase n=1 Tax=Leptolyngbya TaxID=47251 RepID=UPI00168836DC|nr:NAD(P)H-dependent oxidoreductase [Leptolyngbya sp. FACHB-1624]MBD1858691.1 NAD(P)H-dependent oxidoreductase [Leptolyngbya sp. FACHB-1624]